MEEKKELNIQIGRRIKKARVTAGLTQESFAHLLHLSPKNISMVECGLSGVSISTLRQMCKILGVSSDELLFGEVFSTPTEQLMQRLQNLSTEQFCLVEDIVNRLLESFINPDEIR